MLTISNADKDECAYGRRYGEANVDAYGIGILGTDINRLKKFTDNVPKELPKAAMRAVDQFKDKIKQCKDS